jgi:hypothetical protein
MSCYGKGNIALAADESRPGPGAGSMPASREERHRNGTRSGSVRTDFPLVEHFQAKHALGLDPRVDTGSPSENTTTKREKERSPILTKRDSL